MAHSSRLTKSLLSGRLSQGLKGDFPETSLGPDLSLECVEFGQLRPAELILYCTVSKQVIQSLTDLSSQDTSRLYPQRPEALIYSHYISAWADL